MLTVVVDKLGGTEPIYVDEIEAEVVDADEINLGNLVEDYIPVPVVHEGHNSVDN